MEITWLLDEIGWVWFTILYVTISIGIFWLVFSLLGKLLYLKISGKKDTEINFTENSLYLWILHIMAISLFGFPF
jgi:hypothetical protein